MYVSSWYSPLSWIKYEKVSGKLSCCITTTNIDGCVYTSINTWGDPIIYRCIPSLAN